MTSGLEDPIMDNTSYIESKCSEEKIGADETLMTSEYDVKNTDDKKKSAPGSQNNEENFDFTADIIDLLLCVENDENARQNIESIMDQWDEMNILGEDNSKPTGNSETNAQITTLKPETTSKEENLNMTIPDNVSEENASVYSTLPLQNTMKRVCPDRYENTQPANNDQNLNLADRNENIQLVSSDQKLNTVTETPIANDTPSSSEGLCSPTSSIIACETSSTHQTTGSISASPTIMKKITEVLSSRSQPAFSYSVGSSRSQESSSSKSESNDLNEKIRALVCIVCGKNYEQIMNSGCIPKVPCKPYPCPFCRGNYYHKSSADLHMKVHIEEGTLKCRLCTDTTDSVRKRNESVNIEDEILKKRMKAETFSCSLCPAKLYSRADLDKHLAFHRNTRRKNFRNQTVAACDRKANERVLLENKQAKLLFQKQVTKLECGVCGKVFTDKSNYDFHCLSHNTKFTSIFDNIVSEKSNRPNALDHNYGKSSCTTNDRVINTDENENLKKVELDAKTEIRNMENSGTNDTNENALMDIDGLVSYDSVKLNEEGRLK